MTVTVPSPLSIFLRGRPRRGGLDLPFLAPFVPDTFWIANLADVVPVLRPTSVSVAVRNVPYTFTYGDAGQEWSYLWQTGDLGGNHAMATNYLPAASAGVATDAPRTYPASGL